MRLRTGLTGLLVGVLMTVGGVAMAASNDTLLVEGFDSENNTLIFGASEIDEDGFDCTVEGSGHTYVTDGAGTVTSLTKNGQSASFKLAGVDVPYGQTSGVCDLTAVDVTGPAGQVNHGQVVSSFVHALKEQLKELGVRGGIGCLARIVAHSDYGKGDQQQGPTIVDQTLVLSGEVDLTAHEATCHHGQNSDEPESDDVSSDDDENGNNGNGNGNGNGHGNGHGNNGDGNGNKK